jgi:hypothetical protein
MDRDRLTKRVPSYEYRHPRLFAAYHLPRAVSARKISSRAT